MKFIQPDWPAPAHIHAYTTTRIGWGGRKPHHDLNKGNYTETNTDYIDESNRLIHLLNLPHDPIWISQVHSTTVVEAHPENKEKTADASYTHKPQHICVVITADCLPILICNQQGTSAAAIHAGWRGLSGGIIETTLQALSQPGSDCMAWLGPAIGPQKFEVGKDVFDAFVSQHPESETAFAPYKENKWLADLYELARIRLKQQGITQIYGGQFCTYTQDDLFFSYRRDNGKTGRMASLIWIGA